MAKHSTRNQRLGWVLFVLYLGALFYLMFFADMAERGLGVKENYTYNLKPFWKSDGIFFVHRKSESEACS